ncbi:MAG TPA: hypothetical protein PK954_19370 [Anaerolineales bacterium]|nr:hypothetical protein [Anaerolineales bacterium]
MSKWIDAPTLADVQLLAQDTGYAVRVDPAGFHVRNTATGRTRVVGSIDDAIEIVCGRTL